MTIANALRSFAALVLLGMLGAAGSPRAAAPMVRLYVLDCGTIHTDHSETFGLTPREAGITDMAVPCFLVRHGTDYLLFDTGLG